MKTLWNALSIIATAHLLALVAFVAFLGGTGRLSRERVDQVRELFAISVTDQIAIEDEEAERTAKEREAQEEIDRRDEANGGAGERNEAYSKMDDILRERTERFERTVEISDAYIEGRIRELEAKESALREQEAAFLAEVERQRLLRDDENFQTTLTFFKGMEPESQKAILGQWLQEDKREFVLDILSALDKNSAQSLFEQFTTPEDHILAADLLERLRERGFSIASGS